MKQFFRKIFKAIIVLFCIWGLIAVMYWDIDPRNYNGFSRFCMVVGTLLAAWSQD